MEEFYQYKKFLDDLATQKFKSPKPDLKYLKEVGYSREDGFKPENTKVQKKVDNSQKIDIKNTYKLSLPPELISVINNETTDFDQPFSDPTEIIRIFHDLEEKNLYLIRIAQDIE